MRAETLPIAGALRVIPEVFADERGLFKEVFSTRDYREVGIACAFVQDNVSISKRDVLRGLHGDRRMAKLVQVLQGEAYDVIADVRPQSPTYLQWHGEYLRAAEHTQLFIPEGCLHGFLAVSDDMLILYKQTALYDPSSEFGIIWNDPDLNITWPLHGAPPILSRKDAALPALGARI